MRLNHICAGSQQQNVFQFTIYQLARLISLTKFQNPTHLSINERKLRLLSVSPFLNLQAKLMCANAHRGKFLVLLYVVHFSNEFLFVFQQVINRSTQKETHNYEGSYKNFYRRLFALFPIPSLLFISFHFKRHGANNEHLFSYKTGRKRRIVIRKDLAKLQCSDIWVVFL